MYRILSLDLGTNTGWVDIQDANALRSGVLHLPGPIGHPGRRFIEFQNFIVQFKDYQHIFYEDVPRFESAKAARVYCGLLCIVQMFSLRYGIALTNAKSNVVKKQFTGIGNCQKELVCEVAHKLGWKGGHPLTRNDHDEADAIACAWTILNDSNIELKLDKLKAGQIIELPKRQSHRSQQAPVQSRLFPGGHTSHDARSNQS